MAQHAFVAMPFGYKEGIDFNSVYEQLIRPALQLVGLDVFRADEELRAGNIRTDLFQELLLADLIVVDLSIDNPNVWYELGVRHALRPRGVVQIQGKRDYLPFDVYVDRALRYRLKDGAPDPACLGHDIARLGEHARATLATSQERRISPVYHLLPNLQPPDWKSLRIGPFSEYWMELEAWERQVEAAQRAGRVGDILVFAEEAPTRILELEARLAAGHALSKMGQTRFALDQYQRAIEIDPGAIEAHRRKAVLVGRHGSLEMAEVELRALAREYPKDAKTLNDLGKVMETGWIQRWRNPESASQNARSEAALESSFACEAIETYVRAFRSEPAYYAAGKNALMLWHVLNQLGVVPEDDPEGFAALEGGVRWAIECALNREPRDYNARVTLAELELLTGSVPRITDTYNKAIAVSENDQSALQSAIENINVLKDLGFRPAEVSIAENIVHRAVAKLPRPDALEPRQVFLFSGHMIDKPTRPAARFPNAKVTVAGKAIDAKLDELGANEEDLGFSGAACGGDLLFAEACLRRKMHLRIRIPRPEPEFVEESVAYAGEEWRDRYYRVKENPRATILPMPSLLGPSPIGRSPYARSNLWRMYAALSWGPEKVRFLCLWDGKAGDGPGGTEHMRNTVRKHSGRIYVLDVNTL